MSKPIVNAGGKSVGEVAVYTVVVVYNSGTRETWTAFGKDGASAMVNKFNSQRHLRNIRSVYSRDTGKTVRCPS